MNFQQFLNQQKQLPYYQQLQQFLQTRSNILPPRKDWFNAFLLCDFNKTRVVLIGQDPYHNYNQAHGLSFSVRKGVVLPPSLRNMFQELEADLGIKNSSGDLSSWASQGVLLLNTILTVELNQPLIHQKKGWEQFTHNYLARLVSEKEKLVFVLLGNYAKNVVKDLDLSKQHIIMSAHPSPLSAHRGFFGSRIFSRINNYLNPKIDWRTF